MRILSFISSSHASDFRRSERVEVSSSSGEKYYLARVDATQKNPNPIRDVEVHGVYRGEAIHYYYYTHIDVNMGYFPHTTESS